ncbi:MAG: alpha/beta fold hydrolase, partial [Planctomycetota bacterium]
MNGLRWIDAPATAHGRAARLAVHATGKGPLAVLLHGYPLDHRMWLAVLRSPLAARRTLVALDLRGHGHSPAPGDAVHS